MLLVAAPDTNLKSFGFLINFGGKLEFLEWTDEEQSVCRES